jgi:hypothetical protein
MLTAMHKNWREASKAVPTSKKDINMKNLIKSQKENPGTLNIKYYI